MLYLGMLLGAAGVRLMSFFLLRKDGGR